MAFERTLLLPLPKLFRYRYGPIPPIADVRDQTGDWRSAGQSRTIVLQGPGTMREELTEVDPPRRFRYRITELTGPNKALIDHVEGSWSFDPVGTGVRVTWAWDVHPKSGAAARALPVFGRLWSGYARRALEVLEAPLVR